MCCQLPNTSTTAQAIIASMHPPPPWCQDPASCQPSFLKAQGKRLPSSLLRKEGGQATHPSLCPSSSLPSVAESLMMWQVPVMGPLQCLVLRMPRERKQAQPTCNSPSREKRPVNSSLHTTPFVSANVAHLLLVDMSWLYVICR